MPSAAIGKGARNMEELKFRVLGPVEILRGGKPVVLTGRYAVNMLAALLLSANKPVTYDTLADMVWGDSLPAHPRAALQSLKSRLHRILGDDTIQTLNTGYQISAGDDKLDLLHFERLIAVADEALSDDSAYRAVAAIDQALSLWKLPVLANVRSDILLRDGVSFLTELHLSAQEKRAALQLRLGHYPAIIAQLSGLVSAHPFREVMVGLLMLALYRSHRQAEALSVYENLQQALREGLGVDPSEALQRLHVSILRRDASLDHPDVARTLTMTGSASAATMASAEDSAGDQDRSEISIRAAKTSAAVHIPRELPPDIGDFTGRDSEMSQIVQAFDGTSACKTVVLAGPGGIGKSALAVHAGHQLSTVFTDGQVYINAGPAGRQPRDPADIVADILLAFGICRQPMPGTLPERVGLYRSLVADKRFLLILDDVDTETQIRDLLPPGPGCAAIICARRRLAGFAGAQLIELTVLDKTDAVTLLSQIVQPQRLSSEPRSAVELIRLCGGLPLALRIVGARLTAKPHWQLATLAQRLADERRGLDELTYGDLDVRATIAVSYSGLPSGSQAMLCKLALLDAPVIPLWACAALLGGSTAEAEEQCETLVDAQLIQATGGPFGPHYRLHDLVRAFARELAPSHRSHSTAQPALLAADRRLNELMDHRQRRAK